jgi:hypothetical protein
MEVRSSQRTALGHSRYPILIILDSDDLLFPHAAATVASVWTPETVKAQYQFVTIDCPKGSVWLQECRLFAAKLPDEPLYEPIFTTLCSAIRAYVRTSMPFAYRIIRIAWLSSIAAAPRTLATCLLAFRFVPGETPAWIERLLSTVANTRSWRGWLGSLRDEPHGDFKPSIVSQLNSRGIRPNTSGPDGSNDRSPIS